MDRTSGEPSLKKPSDLDKLNRLHLQIHTGAWVKGESIGPSWKRYSNLNNLISHLTHVHSYLAEYNFDI